MVDHCWIAAGMPAEQKQLIRASQIAAHKTPSAPESPLSLCYVTDRERRGEWIAHAHKTWTPAVSFHVGKLTSACVFIAVMADWNRSNHFDTPCRCNWYMNPQNYRYAWGKIQILFQDIQRSSLSTRLDIKAAGLQWFITVSGIEKKSLETIRQTSNDHEVTQWRHLLCSAKQTVQIHYLAHHNLTHCGRVKLICVFNTVKLGTSASSP